MGEWGNGQWAMGNGEKERNSPGFQECRLWLSSLGEWEKNYYQCPLGQCPISNYLFPNSQCPLGQCPLGQYPMPSTSRVMKLEEDATFE
ncbi:MAG: hypothetical protein KME31_23505 [Tolypothrix carrinoi HA7290-LM1]|nr:hypothetical protein [Tolypothrix carrinoi HA7290-LM1]